MTYTGISITPVARESVRRLTATVTGQTGQRLSMSDALRIAERIVAAHPTEVIEVATALGIVPASGEEPPR